MKHSLLFTKLSAAALLLIQGQSYAQIRNATTLTIQSGANLYFDGAAINEAAGTISNSGTLHLKGDFTNNGTALVPNLVKVDGSGAQSINGLSTFETLDVDKPAGTATVTSGTTSVKDILRLNEGTMNANGNLVIISDASGTGLVDDFTVTTPGTLTGNMRMQRYIDANPVNGYHFIGSPVNTPSVATQLSELNLYGPDNAQGIPLPTCDPNAIDPSSPYGNLFDWRETGPFQNNCDQWGWYIRSGGTMTNARGYAALVFNAPMTLEVAGVANTSAVSNVSYPSLSNTNTTGNGWQLVSNPFPSPILWNNVPAGFDAQAHFWQDGGYYSGTYQPLMPGTGPANLIGSMQGFFIRTSGTNQNFTLTQNHRSLGDPPFFATSYENNITLIIEGNGFADKTNLYFSDEGPTNDWDSQFDANKIKSKGAQPTLYTNIEDKKISINALQFTGHPNTIPMGLIPGVNGSYTITANGLPTFDVASQIFLEDLREGTIQNLFTDPVYAFTADVNDNEDRFLLHFNLAGETTGIQNPEDNNVVIYAYSNQVNMLVNFDKPQSGIISVFNMIGQEIYTESGSYIGRKEIRLDNIAAGGYIVRAIFEKNVYTQKVVLNGK